MGIKRFFNTVRKSRVANPDGVSVRIGVDGKAPIKSDSLYVDFNSIAHTVSSRVMLELNSALYDTILGSKPGGKLASKYGLSGTPKLFSDEAEAHKNDIIIDSILDELLKIVAMFNTTSLRLIYVAIDGSPSKAKMIEQKRRRHIAQTMFKIKKSIF